MRRAEPKRRSENQKESALLDDACLASRSFSNPPREVKLSLTSIRSPRASPAVFDFLTRSLNDMRDMGHLTNGNFHTRADARAPAKCVITKKSA
jgi:hypothetical protein